MSLLNATSGHVSDARDPFAADARGAGDQGRVWDSSMSGLDSFLSENAETQSDARYDASLASFAAEPGGPAAVPDPVALTSLPGAFDRARGEMPDVSRRGVIAPGVIAPSAIRPGVVAPLMSLLRRTAHLAGATVSATPQLLRRLIPRDVRLFSAAAQARIRVNPWHAAIVAVCIVGVGEIGWVGFRVMKGAAQRPARARDNSPVPTTGTANAEGGGTVSPQAVAQAEAASPGIFSFITSAGRSGSTGSPGWLTVSAPVPVEVFEGGHRVGNSWSGVVRLSPGHHELEIVNRAQGIDVAKTIDIVSGGRASLLVEAAPGLVNITAVPSASVRIDDAAVGNTPLANLQLTPGPHQVVFRHPRFGERRMKIIVPSGKTLQVSADLRR
jgi:hypothetical protein